MPVSIFQFLMIMDVVHALLRLVGTSPMTAAMQVASRVAVVAILLTNEIARTTVLGLSLILFAWCPTEVLRYSYYIINSLCGDKIPKILTWLRYSTFIILYPIGISGELIIMYTSIAYYRTHQTLYWFPYVIYAIFVIYIPGSIYLYTHMIHQRKKKLSPAPKPEKKLN